LAGGLIQLGCNHSASAPQTTSAPIARLESEINPTLPPPEQTVLDLAGTKIPLQLHAKLDGAKFTIELDQGGQEFEKEEYLDQHGTFEVRSVAGETYDPPIKLLDFPLHEGDTYTWSGYSSVEKQATRSSAETIVSRSQIVVGSLPIEAIKVRVSLKIYENRSRPRVRDMTFYFAPHYGLFKREYGTSSGREPKGQ